MAISNLRKILLRTRRTHWIAHTVHFRILQQGLSEMFHFQQKYVSKENYCAGNDTSFGEVSPSGTFEKYLFVPAEPIG